MSLTASMIPLAIAFGASLTRNAADKLKNIGKRVEVKDAETVFTDHDILIRTLNEHGLPTEAKSDNLVLVRTKEYDLTYERAKRGDAFLLTAAGRDGKRLAVDIGCLEKEYLSNVQSYTYDRLMRNLSEKGMTVESEEVMEDDSIVITINI